MRKKITLAGDPFASQLHLLERSEQKFQNPDFFSYKDPAETTAFKINQVTNHILYVKPLPFPHRYILLFLDFMFNMELFGSAHEKISGLQRQLFSESTVIIQGWL